MKDKKDVHKKPTDRRSFLKLGLLAGGAAVTGIGLSACSKEEAVKGEKVKVLTTDGKLVEVDSASISEPYTCLSQGLTDEEVRQGIPNRKFVMVVDLARCKNALKCQEACNKNHHIPGDNAWLKVYKMQQEEDTAPYWMPTMCQHCDEPACVTVCPVDATFKRQDGIVLIDNERCIGCRFCMAACPYGTRVFNWNQPKQNFDKDKIEYSPEHAGLPSEMGTVDKCDFCPHETREGRLPHCVASCPNDAFWFGDLYEDTVTNGSGVSTRLSALLEERSGYRLLDDLGTKPSVYYLPPVNRTDPFEDGLENYTEYQSVNHNTEENE